MPVQRALQQVRPRCRLRRARIRRLVVQELPDQIFQHDRRLRHRNGVAGLEHLVVAARLQADVLLAEQARRQDLRRRILRKLVLLVDIDRDQRLIRVLVEADRVDAAHRHARALHRRTRLQSADIVELQLDRVGRLKRQRTHVAGLQREKQQRHETQHHEEADPEVESRVFFIVFPKNLVAVFCVKDCALHNVHEPVSRIATHGVAQRPE